MSFYVGTRDFSVVEDVSERVFALIVPVDGVVHVRTCRTARVPEMCDHVSTLHNLSDFEIRFSEKMTIHRFEAVAVVELHVVADAAIPLDFFDNPVRCCQDIRSAVPGDIQPAVELPLSRVGVRSVAVPVRDVVVRRRRNRKD